MALNIGLEVAKLKSMTVGQLREKYREVFGEPTWANNKDFLFKRIIWRLQALEEGDLSERARRRAEELARDADLRTTAPRTSAAQASTYAHPGSPRDRVPPPGSVLTRTYRGLAHHVAVRDDGFEYDGEVYKSLSAVAKKITGTHWNGLLFFGIAKQADQRTGSPAKSKRQKEGVHG